MELEHEIHEWIGIATKTQSPSHGQPRPNPTSPPSPSPKSPGHRQCVATLETVKTDYHFATPLLATPGKALGESIDLVVVATGKGEQLSDKFL